MNHTVLQRRFVAHIRDPQQALPPGVAMEHMAIYGELFFNNLDGSISSDFPVLCRLFDEPRWHRLVCTLIHEYHCCILYLSQLGEELIGQLQDGYHAEEGDPPFLLEPAHYEQVELTLLSTEMPVKTLPQAWLQSPLAWPLAYRRPVHRLESSYRPMEPPTKPICPLVWCDSVERVRFLHLSPFVCRLAQHLSEEGEASVTLPPLLHELAGSYGLSTDVEYFENAFALLEDWHAQGTFMDENALE